MYRVLLFVVVVAAVSAVALGPLIKVQYVSNKGPNDLGALFTSYRLGKKWYPNETLGFKITSFDSAADRSGSYHVHYHSKDVNGDLVLFYDGANFRLVGPGH